MQYSGALICRGVIRCVSTGVYSCASLRALIGQVLSLRTGAVPRTAAPPQHHSSASLVKAPKQMNYSKLWVPVWVPVPSLMTYLQLHSGLLTHPWLKKCPIFVFQKILRKFPNQVMQMKLLQARKQQMCERNLDLVKTWKHTQTNSSSGERQILNWAPMGTLALLDQR